MREKRRRRKNINTIMIVLGVATISYFIGYSNGAYKKIPIEEHNKVVEKTKKEKIDLYNSLLDKYEELYKETYGGNQ